ncbi:MAG: glycerophosphodiester phosphodiesterase [Gammaproteobacteria bacterium]|nr:glycerophosphodiester phosphodiesterase [Gammaproteobacteria bacterium]
MLWKLLRSGLTMGLIGLTGSVHALDLQGHRGARGLMPENTLAGFARALSIGVTTLELDLAVTADAEVVVIHNPQFEPEIARDSTGKWLNSSSPAISSMTLEKVKTFDVGRLNPASKYARRYPQQMAVDGSTVPTLAEVFELVHQSGNQLVRFNIEVKINPEKPALSLPPKDFVEAVIKVIREYDLADRITVQSFDWRALRAVQDLASDLTTSYLTADQRWLSNLQSGIPGPSPWLNGLDVDDFGGSAARAIKAAGGHIWSSYHKEIDAAAIRQAHRLGVSVYAWTVNDSRRMRELIAMGVDGIITDYPDRLRQVIDDLGLPLPKSTPVEY